MGLPGGVFTLAATYRGDASHSSVASVAACPPVAGKRPRKRHTGCGSSRIVAANVKLHRASRWPLGNKSSINHNDLVKQFLRMPLPSCRATGLGRLGNGSDRGGLVTLFLL